MARKLAVAGFFLTVFCGAIFAQTQSINGTIRGRVTDAAAANVPGAAISVNNDATGFARSVESNSDGIYVVPNLPLGTYTVKIAKEGFDVERHTNIVLDAGTEAVIDSQLKVGSLSSTVEVTSGAPIVETSRTSIGRTISHDEVDNLPLTSRNPYNFIIFQPGVSGHPNAELGIPRTINTNGLLDHINYQLDGMVDTESDRTGLRLFPISDVYVREIQTVSNSFAPEFGQTGGIIYNAISNSGANQFHGELYFIGRPVALNARPILLSSSLKKPNLTLNDFALNSGGPVIKDRVFFFAGYEHLTRGLPQPDSISSANAAAIGLSPSLLQIAPSIQHAQFVNIRFDWTISNKHQFFVRYNYFRNEYPYNTGVGGLNALDVAADFHDRAHILGAQLLSTLSPSMLNELRFGWPYRNEKHVRSALTGAGPQVSISGAANFGGTVSAGDAFQEKIPNLNDNFTLIKGAHTFKFGFGLEQILDTQTTQIYNQFVFSSVANYLSAKSGANPFAYSTYNAVVGQPGALYHSFFWNFFLQDTWQARPNVLVTYGVRYDRFQAPPGNKNALFAYSQHFRTPASNLAPRLGIAWSINPKTVVRVNSGIFYESPPTNLWFSAYFNDGTSRAFVANIGPGQAGAPPFPLTLASLPAGFTRATPDIETVTPNFKNAYTINASIQLERQLSTSDSISLGFVHTAGRNLEFLRNLNLINPIGALADGRPVFSSSINAATRLDPRFNNIAFQDIGAVSDYEAMLVTFHHRFTHGFNVNASYTWSHSISDAPEINGFEQNQVFIEDPTNRRRDRGNSLANRPQALTMSAILAPQVQADNRVWKFLANNNELALLANVSSGDQQNLVGNKVLNGDPRTSGVTRPLYIGRNAVRGPNVYQFDGRYTRTFFTIKDRIRPKFIAESNNIFNHKNINALNVTVPVDASGLPTIPAKFQPLQTGILEGRILQFGVRVDW